ncbi:MAG: PIN domain-containing protein [Acidimicrobiales bacterium]
MRGRGLARQVVGVARVAGGDRMVAGAERLGGEGGDAVVVLDEAIYSALEGEARARSLHDLRDWPVVACALALSAGVWTNDNDVLGNGVPTWTTATLQAWLDRNVES